MKSGDIVRFEPGRKYICGDSKMLCVEVYDQDGVRMATFEDAAYYDPDDYLREFADAYVIHTLDGWLEFCSSFDDDGDELNFDIRADRYVGAPRKKSVLKATVNPYAEKEAPPPPEPPKPTPQKSEVPKETNPGFWASLFASKPSRTKYCRNPQSTNRNR